MGDVFAKHFSRYRRPSVNQFSIAVTAPLVAVYFKGLPGLPSLLLSSLTLAGHTISCFMASTVLLIDNQPFLSSRPYSEAFAAFPRVLPTDHTFAVLSSQYAH